MLLFFLAVKAQTPSHLFSINQSLQSPIRVALDNSGNIYTTDATQNNIIKYDPLGNFVEAITPIGCSSVISIAIADDNQIFVGDGINGNIFKLNTGGSLTELYSGTLLPSDMVFDASNQLYVADSKLQRVLVLDLSGNLVRTIGSGTLIFPSGIAFDRKNNRVIVGEHGATSSLATRVYVFDLLGNLINTLGSYGSSNGRFHRVQGITVDTLGNIYVCDPYQATITEFNASGLFVQKFGQFGTSLGKLNVPLDIAHDAVNNHFIVSSMNNGALEVFGFPIGTPLPVELFEFTAVKYNLSVLLHWATASEMNSNKFDVERSADGNNFSLLKTVDGAGNSTQIRNYETTDNEPLLGVSYYRLKQIDFNGSYRYSKIVSVFFSQKYFFNIQPTLVNDKATVSYYAENENIEITIYGVDGKQFFKKTFDDVNGDFKFEIDWNGYQSGIYYVSMKSGENAVVKKIVKY